MCIRDSHTTAKEVISRRRKNENVFKMSKDEKCTCKACKNTIFHCKICKFVGFLLPSSSWLLKLPIRKFKKLRWLLQRRCHFKIEIWVRLSVSRLFHVDHVVQNRRSTLSLAWHEWFSYKGKEWKIYCCRFALLSEPQIWNFQVVVRPTTSKNCSKKRAARTARLFFRI